MSLFNDVNCYALGVSLCHKEMKPFFTHPADIIKKI